MAGATNNVLGRGSTYYGRGAHPNLNKSIRLLGQRYRICAWLPAVQPGGGVQTVMGSTCGLALFYYTYNQ